MIGEPGEEAPPAPEPGAVIVAGCEGLPAFDPKTVTETGCGEGLPAPDVEDAGGFPAPEAGTVTVSDCGEGLPAPDPETVTVSGCEGVPAPETGTVTVKGCDAVPVPDSGMVTVRGSVPGPDPLEVYEETADDTSGDWVP